MRVINEKARAGVQGSGGILLTNEKRVISIDAQRDAGGRATVLKASRAVQQNRTGVESERPTNITACTWSGTAQMAASRTEKPDATLTSADSLAMPPCAVACINICAHDTTLRLLCCSNTAAEKSQTLFGRTEILHTTVGIGGGALAAAVVSAR